MQYRGHPYIFSFKDILYDIQYDITIKKHVILNIVVLADSEDGSCDRDEDRPLDHDEEIDMDDFEYCPIAHTKDKMSQLFQNIPDLISFSPDEITKTVERMTIPYQDINIKATEYEEALLQGIFQR